MKVTKSQLKELIKHTIVDLTEKIFGSKAQYDAYRKKHNLKPGSKHKVAGKTVTVRDTKKMSKKAKSTGDRMADKLNKRMADLEKKRKQGKSVFDVGGPAHPNVKKKRKVKESTRRKYTIKEIRMWMKKLEENRYKKVYNSDARRVAWMVNNEGVSLDEMPISMKKKWTKAQYGRERYLATEFLKSKSEQMNEAINVKKMVKAVNKGEDVVVYDKKGKKYSLQSGDNKAVAVTDYLGSEKTYQTLPMSKVKKIVIEGKLTEDKFIAFYKKDRVTVNAKSLWDAKKQIIAKLKVPKKDVGLVSVLNKTEYDKQKFRFEQKLRESIRKIIKEQLNEAKMVQLQIPIRDKLKVNKILKKSGGKMGKNYDFGVGKAGTFILELDKKLENKVLELMIKNRIQVQEV